MGREFDEDLDVCECTNVHGVVMEGMQHVVATLLYI